MQKAEGKQNTWSAICCGVVVKSGTADVYAITHVSNCLRVLSHAAIGPLLSPALKVSVPAQPSRSVHTPTPVMGTAIISIGLSWEHQEDEDSKE